MRQLMADLAQGADIASSGHLSGQQQLRVLASVSATHGLLLATLNTFHDQYPLVRVQLGEAEGADQLLSVARGEVDLVACRQPPVLPQGWVFEPLVDDELVVVCGPQHPLAQRRDLRWADLADQPWQLGPVGSIARTRLDELAQRFADGVKAFPLVTRMPAALAGALQQRPVLGFLPLSYLRHMVDARELVVLPLDERFPIDPLGVMVPADARSEAAEWLRAHVRLHCQAACE